MMIWHPRDAKPFTRAEFADFHRRNPDGFGAIWRVGDRLHYAKGCITLGQTWALYRRLLKEGHRGLALHWRLATAGGESDANCHPFRIGRVLLMHNGVLKHRSTKTLSDTRCFIADELKDHVSPEVIRDARWAAWLDRRIGEGNRMLLWGDDPEPVIVGEGKGLWHKGRWYSNRYAWSVPATLKPPKYYDNTYTNWVGFSGDDY